MGANMILLPLMMMLFCGMFIFLFLLRGLLNVLSDDATSNDQMNRDEAALIQEIYRSMERLEQRIEPLEDQLFARERAERRRP